MVTNLFEFANSQKAWEGVNEFLFIKEKELQEKGQGRLGNATVAHNIIIYIRKAWCDPEFCFANLFGYRPQKWSSLINNYVDMNHLDIVKADILSREFKKNQSYSVTMHFSNTHNSGKDCLISLTFSRRIDHDVPVLTFHARATEVTKRMLWDLLLIQRIGEYIYGEEQSLVIYMIPQMMYLNAETFTMYHKHRNLDKMLKKAGIVDLQPIQKRTMTLVHKFSTIKPEELTYRVHRRSVRSLQNLNNIPSLKVKDIILIPKSIDYPENCITESQRKKFRKTLKQK